MFIDYIDKIGIDFQSEYMQKPYFSEEWRRVCEAVEEYNCKCDRFDEVICSGRVNGVAVPVNGHERKTINVHALKIREHVCSHYRIDYKQFQEGLKNWNRSH
jgi:hypothetical protein